MWSTRPSTRLNDAQPTSNPPTRIRPGGRARAMSAARPEQEYAAERHQPGRGVKQAVQERVVLERADVRRRLHGTRHVVPLQDLMQDDAVGESPEVHAQHHGRQDERLDIDGALGRGIEAHRTIVKRDPTGRTSRRGSAACSNVARRTFMDLALRNAGVVDQWDDGGDVERVRRSPPRAPDRGPRRERASCPCGRARPAAAGCSWATRGWLACSPSGSP